MSAEKETHQADRIPDHDYDGIQEYDNRLPNWRLWTLLGTIVFFVGYWLVFHTYGIAKNHLGARGLTEADLVAMSSNQDVLAEGKAVYAQYCQVCHLAEGQGLVGPNLTDVYWINGGSAVDIHDTIVNGVVEKGMVAWGRQLGPDRVDAVTAHLLTMRGTNVVGGKPPQGELYESAPEALLEGAAETEGAATETAASTE